MKKSTFPIHTNIFKKTHRSGKASWIVRWKCPLSGKWKKVTAGKTKNDAKLLEARVRNELITGKDPSVPQTNTDSIQDLIEDFYQSPRFLAGSEGWKIESRARIAQWIQPQIGYMTISEVTQDQILRVYLNMKENGLARSSIMKAHTLICLIFDHYESKNPNFQNRFRNARNMTKLFPKRAPQREINFLTPEELKVLFESAKGASNPLFLPLIIFLSHSGLRRSEALNLKWTDIDESSGFIHVRKSKNGQSRIVPFEIEAKKAIEPLTGYGEFIFTYENGFRPHEDSFLKPLRAAAKAAGIKKRIDLHTFRHSYGSNKIRKGFGLQKVSRLLGHSDITITSQIYTHLLDGDLKVQDSIFNQPQEESVDQLTTKLLESVLKCENGFQILKSFQSVLNLVGDLTKQIEQKEESCAPSLPRNNDRRGFDAESNKDADSSNRALGKDFEVSETGRGDVIRTRDLFVPNEAR
jgi:integrase